MQFSTGIMALAATLASTVSANPIGETADIMERQAVHPSYANDADFQRTILQGHNIYRKQHGITTPMIWDNTRAVASANYAKQCKFAHTGTPNVGENLAMGYPDAAAVVSAWALERQKYDWNKPGFSSATGHFTALVWKGTANIGCGRANCGSRGWIVVCQYVKQGNVLPASNFVVNVPRQVEGHPYDVYRYRPASKARRDLDADVSDEGVSLVADIKIAGADDI